MCDIMVKVKNDLTNMTFGRLKVICQVDDYINPKGKHYAKWLCQCSCKEHNVIEVRGTNLTTNKNPTRSCGCLQKEKLANTIEKYIKKHNVYSDVLTDEYGDYYIGYCSNTNTKFFVDAKDYDIVKNYCWSEHHPQKNFSTLIAFDRNTGKNIKMHQLLGLKNYDHIDRNELNNRRYNLRLCTNQENLINKSIRSDNTSGVTGVSWNSRYNKWAAELKIGEFRWRKMFDDFNEAVKSRLEAEIKYFEEFAPQQHLYEQYGITNIDSLI